MMKTKLKDFVQHRYHEVEDEDEAARYLDDALPLIGIVVMYFNQLEKHLDDAICSLISSRSDAMGLLVIHGMAYGAKVELFKRISDDLHSMIQRIPPSYKGLHDALKKMGNLRNLVVHADWVNTDESGYTYIRAKIIGDGGIAQEYAQLTADSLSIVIDEISDTQGQLEAYIDERDNPSERE